MNLAAGTRLGPYEIVAPLGAGGMGEVYRARDSRLSREVAVKVLPADLASDAERLSRFAQEARTASALNHPNIVTVYDVGQSGVTSYIAMEWVDGVTLRALLASGPLPVRKMLSLSTQMADGLARAHEAGILHRDLKPENVMVTRDGFVKILDFGLAKFAGPAVNEASTAPTQAHATEPGVVLGTVGYMSPEQASGRTLDHRSDQFSLGAILYEMAAGCRAFQGESAIATLSAILRDEPAPIAERNSAAPAPFCWIVERCLAKDPEERFTSTRDLARDLVMVRDHQTEPRAPVEAGHARGKRVSKQIAAAAALGVLVAAAAFLAGRGMSRPPLPTFHQLAYRRGTIVSARFAPDGQTIVYGAAWSGNPFRLFVTRPEGHESRSLDLPDADIFSISYSGEMAVSLGRHFFRTFDTTGTLAQASLAGGTSRPLLEEVQGADWAPNGKDLAIVRQAGGKSRLEFPIGKVLYETAGWISHPRVSPGGDLVAFLDHPDFASPRGSVAVVDRAGKVRSFPPVWTVALGLAWHPDGGEIWFTAAERGHNRSLEAVTLSGRRRTVLRAPGMLTLYDIARDGRVLLGRDTDRVGLVGLVPGASAERDLSWFDHSIVRDISSDGKTLLFFEGSIEETNYPVYLGKTDGSPPVRIGEGLPTGLSPDGAWALSTVVSPEPAQLGIYPTGPGQPRQLTNDSIVHAWANWLPDGKSVLFAGSEPGRGTRLYLQDLAGGRPRAVTPEGVNLQWHGVSPDGRSVAALGPDRRVSIYPIGEGPMRAIPGIAVDDEPIRWSEDGQSLFVYRRGSLPARVERVDVTTGARRLWKELAPADPTGVTGLVRIRITPDGSSYAYSYQRVLSDLFLAEGLR